jgi:hypothetical protein
LVASTQERQELRTLIDDWNSVKSEVSDQQIKLQCNTDNPGISNWLLLFCLRAAGQRGSRRHFDHGRSMVRFEFHFTRADSGRTARVDIRYVTDLGECAHMCNRAEVCTGYVKQGKEQRDLQRGLLCKDPSASRR